MIATIVYMTNDPTRFVPRYVLQPKPNEKIWLSVNGGTKIPAISEQVITWGDKLGLFGEYIRIRVGQCRIMPGDRLSINQYDFSVVEVV